MTNDYKHDLEDMVPALKEIAAVIERGVKDENLCPECLCQAITVTALDAYVKGLKENTDCSPDEAVARVLDMVAAVFATHDVELNVGQLEMNDDEPDIDSIVQTFRAKPSSSGAH